VEPGTQEAVGLLVVLLHGLIYAPLVAEVEVVQMVFLQGESMGVGGRTSFGSVV
jgi:hypothetical protein